ncbi:MAG: S-adenosylmethionine decarboxylase proenzyme [Thermoproteota archaeon]|nr:MAG: S-adenosylmethionine decarboxylase proenzyme [Candidatus Korarchaeota archaeon]RLG53315.1 MAG: S-adenosylmethionine decarboxylase proenzyme [Candidatus Korarchaeota archaeon]
MRNLGRHLILEFYGCPKELLDSIEYIRDALVKAAKEANATVLSNTFHKFNPQGITGVVVISESHLSIHTWPEYGYAAVDIFTCGDHTDPWAAYEILVRALKPRRVTVTEMKRGILTESELAALT